MSKVKVLVAERDGTELAYQEEASPSSDYAELKGIAFEGLTTHVMEKLGGVLRCAVPSFSHKPTYTSNNLTAFEVFNGFTQTTINRIMRGDFTYTSNNLTQEVWKIYDTSDGTTVLKTITINHTYVANDLTKTEVSEV